MKHAFALSLVSLILSGCVLVPVGPPGSGAYAARPAIIVPAPAVVFRPYYRPWWRY